KPPLKNAPAPVRTTARTASSAAVASSAAARSVSRRSSSALAGGRSRVRKRTPPSRSSARTVLTPPSAPPRQSLARGGGLGGLPRDLSHEQLARAVPHELSRGRRGGPQGMPVGHDRLPDELPPAVAVHGGVRPADG